MWGASRSISINLRRPTALRGGKPRKVKLCTGRPERTSAITNAVGPGIIVTSTWAVTALRTRVKPGSEIPGVPAFVTTATDLPSFSSSSMRSPARCSLCSWKASCGFEMEKCLSSKPVLRVSSLATISTVRSVSSARRVMSFKLPMGVATK